MHSHDVKSRFDACAGLRTPRRPSIAGLKANRRPESRQRHGEV